jgi:hypothetical protein
MLKQTVQKTYIYNAHGHALSGHITKPFEQMIEVQAGMSLPTIGGVGRARVEKFNFQDFVSFDAGYTYLSGSKIDDESYTTLVTATVENLNILDVVTADVVVARVASTQKLDEPEPRITVLGSKIEGLRIAGRDVKLDLADELFLKLTTFASIRNEFQNNAEFRKIAADPFLTGKPMASIETNGVLLCSLVKDMEINSPGIKRRGHAFEVPEFGTVYIGEMLAQHRKRTVTMLRFELGCPFVGGFTASQVVGNGHPLP